MSLVGFHRFLIASGIIFCFGFAAWEFYAWAQGGSGRDLLVGGVFVVLGGLLSVYLHRLKSILNLPQ